MDVVCLVVIVVTCTAALFWWLYTLPAHAPQEPINRAGFDDYGYLFERTTAQHEAIARELLSDCEFL